MTSNSSGSTRVGTQSQPRTSSSSVLWAHLQRKDTANPATSTIPLPPLAPLDKTNTSLRILLHDTQSHFETFADKVNVLTKGVDEAKREIGLTKTLFEKEHEVLSNEMFGLGACPIITGCFVFLVCDSEPVPDRNFEDYGGASASEPSSRSPNRCSA